MPALYCSLEQTFYSTICILRLFEQKKCITMMFFNGFIFILYKDFDETFKLIVNFKLKIKLSNLKNAKKKFSSYKKSYTKYVKL